MTDTVIDSLGEFWSLPDSEQRPKRVGRFTFSPEEGASVSILTEPERFAAFPAAEHTIHGTLHDVPRGHGVHVSLAPAFLHRQRMSGSFLSERWVPRGRAFLGDFWVTAEARFDRVTAEFPGLVPWWPETTIAVQDLKAIRLEVALPPIEVAIDGGTIRLALEPRMTWQRGKVEIAERVVATLARSTPESAETLDDELRPLRYFVRFVGGDGVRPEGIRLHTDDGSVAPLDEVRRPVRRRNREPLLHLRLEEIAPALQKWYAMLRERPRLFDAWMGMAEMTPFLETRMLLAFEVAQLESGIDDPERALGHVLSSCPSALDQIVDDRNALGRELWRDRTKLWSEERSEAALVHHRLERFDWALRLTMLERLGIDPARAAESPSFAFLRSAPR